MIVGHECRWVCVCVYTHGYGDDDVECNYDDRQRNASYHEVELEKNKIIDIMFVLVCRLDKQVERKW